MTVMELPSELVERFYRLLSFIEGRGGGSGTLFFLDCDSSICGGSDPRRACLRRFLGTQIFLPLSQSSSSASVSHMLPVLSLSSLLPGMEGSHLYRPPGPRHPRPNLDEARLRRHLQPIRPLPSHAGTVTGLQSQIKSHYCLPGDWVSPDCVKLMQTFGDGTLLCPRTGEVVMVRRRGLEG